MKKKLIAEAGNSFFKFKYNNSYYSIEYKYVKDILNTLEIDTVILCNTSGRDMSFLPFKIVNISKYDIPERLEYSYDKKQLGIDRMLICEYLYSEFSEDFILFSFGSALTVNIIKDSVFEQGLIVSSKYLNYSSLMRLGDLKSLTGEFGYEKSAIPQNTRQAVLNGIIKMENSFIKDILSENKDINIFITGGDEYIPFGIFDNFYYSENLLLNSIEKLILGKYI
jgi:pantothenate kinase type III